MFISFKNPLCEGMENTSHRHRVNQMLVLSNKKIIFTVDNFFVLEFSNYFESVLKFGRTTSMPALLLILLITALTAGYS